MEHSLPALSLPCQPQSNLPAFQIHPKSIVPTLSTKHVFSLLPSNKLPSHNHNHLPLMLPWQRKKWQKEEVTGFPNCWKMGGAGNPTTPKPTARGLPSWLPHPRLHALRRRVTTTPRHRSSSKPSFPALEVLGRRREGSSTSKHEMDTIAPTPFLVKLPVFASNCGHGDGLRPLKEDLAETIAVVGLGASGRAAARLALSRGASRVVGVDRNDRLPKLECDSLFGEQGNVDTVLGRFDEKLLWDAD